MGTMDSIDAITKMPEYCEYTKALKVAQRAGPLEIPKADGELKYAKKQLWKAIEEAGISPKNITVLMAEINAACRKT